MTDRQRMKVYENGVMRNIFGSEGQEVVREWKIIHSKELYDLYFPPHNIRVKKSRTVR
jgi:hypothetical protein